MAVFLSRRRAVEFIQKSISYYACRKNITYWRCVIYHVIIWLWLSLDYTYILLYFGLYVYACVYVFTPVPQAVVYIYIYIYFFPVSMYYIHSARSERNNTMLICPHLLCLRLFLISKWCCVSLLSSKSFWLCYPSFNVSLTLSLWYYFSYFLSVMII